MNIPFALYDYIALFIPGIVLLLGVSASGVLPLNPGTSSGILEFVIYATVAFVLGHFNQWLSKQVIVALGQFFPVLGHMGKYLINNTYPDDKPKEATRWYQKARNALLALSPLPSVLKYGPKKAKLIETRAKKYSGRDELAAGELAGVCISALQSSQSAAVAKRELLNAQADFHRGTFSALIIVALCEWRWGLPPAISTVKIYGWDRLWIALAVTFVALSMLKRYVTRERDSFDVVYTSFLDLTSPGRQAITSKNDDKGAK